MNAVMRSPLGASASKADATRLMRVPALLLALWAVPATSLQSGAPLASRRAALLGAAAATLPLSQRALAFNLPPLASFEDPKARAAAAKQSNPDKTSQQAAAFYAVTTNDMGSLQNMADGGWDLKDLKDTAGKTVLHRAAQVGNEKAMELLIKSGADVNAVTDFKETPLHLATRTAKLGCIKQLVEAGALTSKTNLGGDTPLMLAQKYAKTALPMADVIAYLSEK